MRNAGSFPAFLFEKNMEKISDLFFRFQDISYIYNVNENK